MNKNVTCKSCGTENLVWVKSKKGNWYLSDPDFVTFGLDGHKMINFAHKCSVKTNYAKSYADVQIQEKEQSIEKLVNVLKLSDSDDNKTLIQNLIDAYTNEINQLKEAK